MSTNNFKLIAVGDDGVGKSTLLSVLNDCPFQSTMPIIVEKYIKKGLHKGDPYILNIWDSACKEEYDTLRLPAYIGVDVVLICFSLVSRESFLNVEKKWFHEVKKFCKDPIIILIGTKQDLRQEGNTDHISDDEINKFAQEQKCSSFIPCSSKNKMNIDSIIPTVINECFKNRTLVKTPEDKDEQIKILMSYIRFLEDRLCKYEPTKQINFEKLLNDQST